MADLRGAAASSSAGVGGFGAVDEDGEDFGGASTTTTTTTTIVKPNSTTTPRPLHLTTTMGYRRRPVLGGDRAPVPVPRTPLTAPSGVQSFSVGAPQLRSQLPRTGTGMVYKSSTGLGGVRSSSVGPAGGGKRAIAL